MTLFIWVIEKYFKSIEESISIIQLSSLELFRRLLRPLSNIIIPNLILITESIIRTEQFPYGEVIL